MFASALTACGDSAPTEPTFEPAEAPAVAQAETEATATSVPTDTPTPAPTDTPVPSNTPTNTPLPTHTPIPTQTPTPTPTPTPTLTPLPTFTFTPTPFPYDLSIQVNDEAGAPVVGVSISVSGVSSLATDASGQATWTNLPADTATVTIAAQGYLPTQQMVTLERGPNQVTIVLPRDPAGLLPAEACAPGETLLYIEDFQDGQAQGWSAIQSAPWSIGPAPDNPGNTVLLISGPMAGNLPLLQDYTFDNAVWRIRVRYDGNVASLLNCLAYPGEV